MMIKHIKTIGLGAGLLILGFIYFNAPGAGTVAAHEGVSICEIKEIALDEGYGVSRVEVRKVCGLAH